MLCQRCHQRQATVFFSQTVGNQTTQAHLCDVCAKEQAQSYGGMNPLMFNPFSALTELLNNIMNLNEGAIAEVNSGRVGPVTVDPKLQCPHCGYQLSTFRQNGRLGCTKCYEAFRTVLQPLITSIHGNVQYLEEGEKVEMEKGKKVKSKAKENPSTKEMREKLKALIETEKYEEAAKVRDEIRKLEKQ